MNICFGGVDTISVPKRYYPLNEFAAHTIGYVSRINQDEYTKLGDDYTQNSVIGKMGIEQTFEKYLMGENGIKKTEVDNIGTPSTETIVKPQVPGKNVTLTLDYRLQKTAEDALVKTINDIRVGTPSIVKSPDVSSGAVAVLDVTTGEVLSLVSYPTFDLNKMVSKLSYKDWNDLINSPLKPMYNRSITGTYSPGSTYKMLVGLAGLQEKKITTNEKIYDPGIYPLGHKPKCWIYESRRTTHGYVNVADAIKVSCNCFFYEVGNRLGIENIVKYTKMFGLGSKTGIELSGEKSGMIAGDNQKEWYLGDTLSASIGQSYNSYTPISLANYISTLSNGGNLNKVTVVKSVADVNKNMESLDEINLFTSNVTGVNFEPKKIDINKEYIDEIKKGMLSVTTDRGGTSYIVFKNGGIQVAGKTGTSQVTSGSNNGIFVGFAPYDKPKIAVVAIIEHGGEGTYTANVVKPIMEEYFKIVSEDNKNVRPQNILDNNVKF
ncbi:MAG: penicillin-binding transpeptidase domain-containing protein [Clostridia bacterium]